jgi:hypothetical protein
MDEWPYLRRLFYRVRDRYNKDMANQELIEDDFAPSIWGAIARVILVLAKFLT